ncbi:phage tail sheath family protein [Rhizobium sp. CECT 9324]|uniref:phage tail sheath family protein n=1 Tax=Rhizobium sp. CECT 9324 TaxID=2845820 RepID=UPI001E5ABD38|nr:phage tail sheath family protein [Rhizobium sp. CECT 9324]CAH0339566.1 Putative prophage major tail sheath protein [Rhizobium sp. CECT 9324]
MSGTTDFVGVRRFSNLTSTVAKIDTRDSTVVGLCVPAPTADNTAFPLDEPVKLSIDDPAQVALLGTGIARDTVDQLLSEGIVTDVAFVRVAHSPSTDPALKLAAEINNIVGNAGSKTGVWALLDAKSHIKLEPGLIIAPGYMAHRLDNAANAVVAAARTIADQIIDCMVIADTPSTSIENAIEWAEDFATALNVIGMYPAGVVNLGGGNVTRPLSANVAGAMIRRDKETGGPYKAFWNRPLQGVLGPSVPVNYRDGDISTEGNQLAQAGVGTIIEGNLLWAPFTTASDPTVNAWRSIKKIRTRRAVEKAMLRPLRQYLSEDMTGHMVSLVYRAADQFLSDLVTLGAIIDYELIWSKAMNPATLLEAGGLRVKMRWAETPDLVDLQLYDEPMPEAFDVLEAAIASSLSQLGLSNVRVTA